MAIRRAPGRIKEPTTRATGDHIAIIGPYSNVWTHETFPTAEAAEEHLRRFWKGHDFDPRKWRLAVATVEVTAHEPAFALPSLSAKASGDIPSGRSQ